MNQISPIATLFFPKNLFILITTITFLSSCCTSPAPSSPTTANRPPVAQITQPATDSGTNDNEFMYDGYDETKGMWYKDVQLEGLGTDAEDGNLTASSLVWTTDQTELQAAELGTGQNLTARLYSNECFGTSHMISLTVTDSDGNNQTETRRITIWTLC